MASSCSLATPRLDGWSSHCLHLSVDDRLYGPPTAPHISHLRVMAGVPGVILFSQGQGHSLSGRADYASDALRPSQNPHD